MHAENLTNTSTSCISQRCIYSLNLEFKKTKALQTQIHKDWEKTFLCLAHSKSFKRKK